VRFEVLTLVLLKTQVLWDMTLFISKLWPVFQRRLFPPSLGYRMSTSLDIEAGNSFGTLVNIYQLIQHSISEDLQLHVET
jgi:hypothetical protein